jgi:chemotaxis response regulator CheB
VLVQDPITCVAASMPAAVMARGAADGVMSIEGIAAAITAMAMVPGAAATYGVA